MAVRLTESAIPTNFQSTDLGQAESSADDHCVLISFITSPIVQGRQNSYVLFVTDDGLASSAQTYEWSFTENENAPTVQGTDEGVTTYSPTTTGTLSITVKVLDAGGTEQSSVDLTQAVVPPNAELEQLIQNASEESGPGISNPAVARELINDHNPYYQAAILQTPEGDDSFKCFLFSTAFAGALLHNSARRQQHIEQLATSLNDNLGDFAELAAESVGVCGIRIVMLAMTLGSTPPIAWTELPEEISERATAEERLRSSLRDLDENVKIDLFNLLRFPKSNITQCGRILEILRDRYFNGTSFKDVLQGMSGTRATWITRHLREGPILRT